MNTLSQFWNGFGAPKRGYRFLKQNPDLWRFGWVPVLLNSLSSLLALFLVGWAVLTGCKELHAALPSAWWRLPVEIVAVGLLIVLGILALVALWILLGAILCSLAFGKLARAVEIRLGTPPESLTEVSLLFEIIDAMRAVFSLIAYNFLFLLIGLLPVIGSTISIAASLYYSWFIFGYEYLDYALSLRGLRRDEKIAIARKQRPNTLGLGCIVFLLNFIPIVGAIFLTTATVGAVLSQHDRTAQ